jgi:hypothetical protein
MVQVFSFCLYNPPNPLYYIGLFENVAMIQKYFPTFLVYIYIGNDVPSDTCDELRKYPNVRLHFTGETGATNMIHRFFAIDDPDVDVMIVVDQGHPLQKNLLKRLRKSMEISIIILKLILRICVLKL